MKAPITIDGNGLIVFIVIITVFAVVITILGLFLLYKAEKKEVARKDKKIDFLLSLFPPLDLFALNPEGEN